MFSIPLLGWVNYFETPAPSTHHLVWTLPFSVGAIRGKEYGFWAAGGLATHNLGFVCEIVHNIWFEKNDVFDFSFLN